MTNSIMTQEYLRSIIHYDPKTGLFQRKWSYGLGKPTRCTIHGYVMVVINKKMYRAHRLAFLYMTGDIPNEVDHIDHNRSNNNAARA